MMRAADCSVRMTISLRISCSSELLISHNMIFTRNLKPLQQQQQRNLHHFSLSILNYPRPNPVGLLHIRGFNSGRDFAKLGLPENASKAEVKSAYFSLAKKLHPDNGGNAKEFNEITEAYKRLSSDSGYGDQSQHGGHDEDPRWMEEMERRRRARMWMEQRMMEEEWLRRRAQQNQWRNFQKAGHSNSERERLMYHVIYLMILAMGITWSLQMLFNSITPSGCPQYELGCTCNKCLEYERWEVRWNCAKLSSLPFRFMRQLGGPRYSRTGHQRGCECKVCVTTGFQYLQHPPNCKCQTCRRDF